MMLKVQKAASLPIDGSSHCWFWPFEARGVLRIVSSPFVTHHETHCPHLSPTLSLGSSLFLVTLILGWQMTSNDDSKAVVGFAVLGSLYYSKIVDYGFGLCARRPIWPQIARHQTWFAMATGKNPKIQLKRWSPFLVNGVSGVLHVCWGFDHNSCGPYVASGRGNCSLPVLGLRLGSGQLGPADDGPSKSRGWGSRSLSVSGFHRKPATMDECCDMWSQWSVWKLGNTMV